MTSQDSSGGEDWRGRAEQLERDRLFDDAEALYVKLFDRLGASRCALEAGREVDAMRHLLEGRHRAEAEALRRDPVHFAADPAVLDIVWRAMFTLAADAAGLGGAGSVP